MKHLLSRNLREKLYDNSDARQEIRNKIMQRVEKEYATEAKLLHEESDRLRAEEKAFTDASKPFIQEAYDKQTTVKVYAQVGKNGSIVREHTGKITKLYKYDWKGIDAFNFSDPTYLDGKEFTIGLSCFMGIESVEQ
jgi:hypothetical protein